MKISKVASTSSGNREHRDRRAYAQGRSFEQTSLMKEMFEMESLIDVKDRHRIERMNARIHPVGPFWWGIVTVVGGLGLTGTTDIYGD